MSDFLTVMRSRTSDIHSQVEREISLEKHLGDLSGYRDLLLRFASIWIPVEESIKASELRNCDTIELNRRMRSEDIRNDLTTVKSRLSDRSSGLDDLIAVTEMTMEEAVGALYVLEGSRFGGSVILREAGHLGITPALGGKFFSGYGKETGAMWKQFTNWADSVLAADRLECAADGADQCFSYFLRQFQITSS
ncbi:MAG: biliverdin-producing heme oxygenase [Verrucomicrobiales bacterium]|nr:biliverdin-producing heme oxygenase [Verrucomicrobiales bacterium]